MTVRAFPKHNFAVDVNNAEYTCMLKLTPTVTGYLESVRVRVVNKNWDGTGRAKIRLSYLESDVALAESAWLNYGDVPTYPTNFYLTTVNFDMGDVSIDEGSEYKLCIYQESATAMGDSHFSYVIDHNFPVNTNILGSTDPIANARVSAELFIRNAYNDFN